MRKLRTRIIGKAAGRAALLLVKLIVSQLVRSAQLFTVLPG